MIFGLLSLVVSALSVILWMINPFTDLLLLLAAPLLSLLGYHPPVQGWSGLGSAMVISFLWPLTLSPLHWLNFRLLRWKKGGTPVCLLCLARHSLGEGGSLIPSIFPSLRNQKKLSCIWIFYDGTGRKTGDIDILSLVRCIRTRDHAFPAWDRNSIWQTGFYFLHIRG